MKTNSFRHLWKLSVALLVVLFACSPATPVPDSREGMQPPQSQTKAAAVEKKSDSSFVSGTQDLDPTGLPVRFQSPAYTLAEGVDPGASFDADGDFVVKVGADISSSSGSVMLRDIMKKLAALKNMNISWASDVDQYSYVDVDIRANDDFFKAIDNLLRQRDYFHEVQGNTIVIKYKETRKFHVALPFMTTYYSATVGAKVTGTSESSLGSKENTFDVWENIQNNLDQVFNIWEEAASSGPPPEVTAEEGEGDDEDIEPQRVSRPQSAKGFYTIDKPVGLVTVTAPRRIIEKVENYLNNLKKELYKQVNIEAKIIEVSLSNSRSLGVNWEDLLGTATGANNKWHVSTEVGNSTFFQPLGAQGTRTFTLSVPDFDLIVNALEEQGKTKVLSNPRISVLNGQPALINVGKNVTYIDKVEVTVSESIVTQSVTTDEASSGIVMSVVPTIIGDDEIILNLTPVTSQLEEPILYEEFGEGKIGLPVMNVKEMSTVVRIKKGEMLIVGGLIDSVEGEDDNNVPFLGNLPIVGWLFKHEQDTKRRKELVVLLKPDII